MEPATLHVPSPSHPTLASALAVCASSPNATIVWRPPPPTRRPPRHARARAPGRYGGRERGAHHARVRARVADLALRQLGDGDARPAAALERAGALVVERRTLGARSRAKAAAVVARGGGAAPRLVGCTVAESGHAGVVLAGGARATLEQTEVGAAPCAACRAGRLRAGDGRVRRVRLRRLGRPRQRPRACQPHGVRAARRGGASGGAALSARARDGAAGRLHRRRRAGVGIQLDEGSDARIERSRSPAAAAPPSPRGAAALLVERCEIADGSGAGVLLMMPPPAGAAEGGGPVLRHNTLGATQAGCAGGRPRGAG